MTRFFVFFCLAALCFGASLKDAKISNDRASVSLTISLDKPFDGKIAESRENSQIILTIDGLSSANPFVFAPKGELVSTLRISPRGSQTIVRIAPKTAVIADARTIGDGRTLLIRLARDANASASESAAQKSANPLADNYLLAGIFIAVLLLLWIVIRFTKGSQNGSWLIGRAKIDAAQIIWTKPIDAKNRFILARFRGKDYLLIVGQNNLLLDVFDEDEKRIDKSQKNSDRGGKIDSSTFEELLRANSVKLSDYLSSGGK